MASCTAAPSTTSTATPGRSCGWTRRPSRAERRPRPTRERLAWAGADDARPCGPPRRPGDRDARGVRPVVSARGTLSRIPRPVRRPDGPYARAARHRHHGRRLPRLPDARRRPRRRSARTAPWSSRPSRTCPSTRTGACSTPPTSCSRASRRRLRGDTRTPSRTPGSSGPRPTATSSPRCCAPSTTTPISDALDELLAGARVVGVMGGHAMARGTDAYAGAARLGRALARAGLTVATGGGPGAMEAANLGAYAAPLRRRRCWTRPCELLAKAPSFTPVGHRLGERRLRGAGPLARGRRLGGHPHLVLRPRAAERRSPRTSPSTSPTPPARTACWPAPTPA